MYNLDPYIRDATVFPIRLPLKEAEVFYYPNFLTSEIADLYYQILFKEINWQQDSITVFGKTYPQPRLTALYGLEGKAYTYSGITMLPIPFNKVLKEIKEKIQKVTKENFTTVLLNLYRNGSDSNGWHSDNEKELGKNPCIASVSFGADRFFQFKNKKEKSTTYKLSLTHGSLLVMGGKTQHYWLHQLPKTTLVNTPRINLTFRKILSKNCIQ